MLFVQIAAGEHIIDRQADAGVKVPAQLQDIGLLVGRVEVGVEDGRRFLEEGS